MALTGLRPAREIYNPVVGEALAGAYNLYAQDVYDDAGEEQWYFLSKWLKLKAGVYRIYSLVETSGEILRDGDPIILPTSSFTPPDMAEFVVQFDSVYRFDCNYRNSMAGTDAYIAYALYIVLKDEAGNDVEELVEVSRAADFLADLTEIPDSALGPKPPYSVDVRLGYPVFLPLPNWKDGVTERIEWQTDVMQSETGAEQRRPIRVYPRRSIEASFLRWEENRQVLDATITGVGANPILLPLWHDMTAVENDAPAGSTLVVGQFRVKDFNVGDVVMLSTGYDWVYEVNVIVALDLDAGHMTLQYGLQRDLQKGMRIFPVRVAQIRESATGQWLTDSVGTTQLRFHCLEPYRLEPSWADMPTYDRTGLHILILPDDWKRGNAVSTERQLYSFDNESGNVVTVDPGQQSYGTIKKSYQIHGRTNDRMFRQLLFALRGRTKTFHLPQGTTDFILTRDINPADGALIVRRCGYTQFVGNTQATKRDILIELYDGTRIPTTIISSRIVGSEEWLFLTQSIPATPMAQVYRIGYMPVARLDVDGIEIKRLTDSAGVSQVSLTFKIFDDRRRATPVPLG